jgi:hypothetical protein
MVVKLKKQREAPAEERSQNGTVEAASAPMPVVSLKAKDGKTSAVSNVIYEEATKEIVALSENDSLARKVDNGPLGEARGKDTWALHATLRALDQLNANLERQASALRTATATLEEHLQADTQGLTSLVERAEKSVVEVNKALESALESIQTHMDRRVHELREETHRLIDKRFNQTDLSFAAVRADQEVVKALITDIIKDRIGREARMR